MPFPDVSEFISLIRTETRLDTASMVSPNGDACQAAIRKSYDEAYQARVKAEGVLCTWMLDIQRKVEELEKRVAEQSKVINNLVIKEM